MSKFTYKSKYGDHPNCWYQTGRYENGNLAVQIWSTDEGPITNVTVNPDVPVSIPRIAIKDYSENEGMVEFLHSEGLIYDIPVYTLNNGFVSIPIYTLTEKGRLTFQCS